MAGYFKDNNGQGWRSCLKCGKRGIKDTFYGRNKEYCSVGCSRVAGYHRDLLFRNRNQLPFIKATGQISLPDLSSILDKYDFAPVDAFHHVPLSRCWSSIFKSELLVEICHESTGQERVWLAKVLGHKGYFTQVKLVGKEKKYYLNPGSVNLFPIGYATSYKKRYGVPYKNFEQGDILGLVENLLQNSNTLSDDIFTTFSKEIVNDYDRLMTYEVIDKTTPGQFLTGRVRNTFGDWIFIKYDLTEDGIWVHPLSGFFRPPGWCQLVGHPIKTTEGYAANSLMEFSRDNDIQSLFTKTLLLENHEVQNYFKVGMKLELLDPFDHVMRVATVAKVLRLGFIIVKLDHDEKSLVFHNTSPHLYPPSFSNLNGIPIMDNNFHKFYWQTYQFKEGESMAPTKCFPQRQYTCALKEGMILETFNLRGHGVVSYAIVLRVIGRIVLIDFLHHPSANGLLVDCDSPCLFPIGFSHILQLRDRSIKFDHFDFADIQHSLRKTLELIREMCRERSKETIELDEEDDDDDVQIISNPDIETGVSVNVGGDKNVATVDPTPADQQKPEQQQSASTSVLNAETPNNAPAIVQPSGQESQNISPQANLSSNVSPRLSSANRNGTGYPNTRKLDLLLGYVSNPGLNETFNEKPKENQTQPLAKSENIEFNQLCKADKELHEQQMDLANLRSTNVNEWTPRDVSRFISRNMKLGRYALNFSTKNIDGKAMMELLKKPEEIPNYIDRVGDVQKFKYLLLKLSELATAATTTTSSQSK